LILPVFEQPCAFVLTPDIRNALSRLQFLIKLDGTIMSVNVNAVHVNL
jgi:hypothetical protein